MNDHAYTKHHNISSGSLAGMGWGSMPWASRRRSSDELGKYSTAWRRDNEGPKLRTSHGISLQNDFRTNVRTGDGKSSENCKEFHSQK